MAGTPAGASVHSQTFSSAGSATFVVPADVTSLTVVAEGAQGADGYGSPPSGGDGGRVTATVSVTPGESLDVEVGGVGTNFVGGFNGGGAPGSPEGGGGGGASDVRQGGNALSDRVVVAGGGGGDWRGAEWGGAGGGTAGVDASSWSGNGGGGGGAGTLSAGGAGGYQGPGIPGSAGHVGDLGVGGAGGAPYDGGGGGGGGYYGGGGGGGGVGAGGGGGGSNYAAGSATAVTLENGINPGDGSVVLSWTTVDPTTTTTTTTAPPATTTTAPPATTTTTLSAPTPVVHCPTLPIRVRGNNLWAVPIVRWVCGFQVSKLRSGETVVTYVVPPLWRWAWTVNPHIR